MKKQPYVGVTGIKTKKEIAALVDMYESSNSYETSGHRLMLGVLASTKKLNQPFEEGVQSPALYKIPGLFEAMAGAKKDFLFPVLHYHPDETENASDELTRMLEFRNLHQNCGAVQINADWPSAQQMENLKTRFSGLELVLQLPFVVTDGIEPKHITEKLREYSGIADYVLIDRSGGKGVLFNLSDYVSLIGATRSALPKVPIVVAGGLDGNNVAQQIGFISQSFDEDFSIDAQGRLRNPVRTSLDIEATKKYLLEASSAFVRFS